MSVEIFLKNILEFLIFPKFPVFEQLCGEKSLTEQLNMIEDIFFLLFTTKNLFCLPRAFSYNFTLHLR